MAYLPALTVPKRYWVKNDGSTSVLVNAYLANFIGTQMEHYYYHGDAAAGENIGHFDHQRARGACDASATAPSIDF